MKKPTNIFTPVYLIAKVELVYLTVSSALCGAAVTLIVQLFITK